MGRLDAVGFISGVAVGAAADQRFRSQGRDPSPAFRPWTGAMRPYVVGLWAAAGLLVLDSISDALFFYPQLRFACTTFASRSANWFRSQERARSAASAQFGC